jgi:hypothetical protein
MVTACHKKPFAVFDGSPKGRKAPGVVLVWQPLGKLAPGRTESSKAVAEYHGSWRSGRSITLSLRSSRHRDGNRLEIIQGQRQSEGDKPSLKCAG